MAEVASSYLDGGVTAVSPKLSFIESSWEATNTSIFSYFFISYDQSLSVTKLPSFECWVIYEGVVYTWVLGGDPFSGWSALMTSRPLKLVNDSFKRKTSRLLRKVSLLTTFLCVNALWE